MFWLRPQGPVIADEQKGVHGTTLKVRAQVSTADSEAVEPVLGRLVGTAGYRVVADGFEIDADLDARTRAR